MIDNWFKLSLYIVDGLLILFAVIQLLRINQKKKVLCEIRKKNGISSGEAFGIGNFLGKVSYWFFS